MAVSSQSSKKNNFHTLDGRKDSFFNTALSPKAAVAVNAGMMINSTNNASSNQGLANFNINQPTGVGGNDLYSQRRSYSNNRWSNREISNPPDLKEIASSPKGGKRNMSVPKDHWHEFAFGPSNLIRFILLDREIIPVNVNHGFNQTSKLKQEQHEESLPSIKNVQKLE